MIGRCRRQIRPFVERRAVIRLNVFQRVQPDIPVIAGRFRDDQVPDRERCADRHRPLSVRHSLGQFVEQFSDIQSGIRFDHVDKRRDRLLRGGNGLRGAGLLELHLQDQPVLQHEQVVRFEFVGFAQRLDRFLRGRLTRCRRIQLVELVPNRSRLWREFRRAPQGDFGCVAIPFANRNTGRKNERDVRIGFQQVQLISRFPGSSQSDSPLLDLLRVHRLQRSLTADGQVPRTEQVLRQTADDLQQQRFRQRELMVLQMSQGTVSQREQFERLFPRQSPGVRLDVCHRAGAAIVSHDNEHSDHRRGSDDNHRYWQQPRNAGGWVRRWLGHKRQTLFRKEILAV